MGLGADWLAQPQEYRDALRKEMRDLRVAHGLDPYGDPEQIRITVEVLRDARARAEEAACPTTDSRTKKSSNGSSAQKRSA